MRMLKRAAVFLMISMMLVLLAGCSGKESIVTIDIVSLSNELLQNAAFGDELNAADDEVIKKLYDIDDYEKAQVYISSGATAEEIAVFEFSRKEMAEKGLKKAQEKIASQKEAFATYIPKEVKKLDDAVVEQFGQYVVVCVSNSREAETIITKQSR